MSNTAEMTDREIRSQIWARLRNYRGSLVLVMVCLTVSVPFMNFHPMVWGIVADRLVADTLTPSVLGLWLAIMFATYLIGIMVGALQSYLLEKTGQAVVRDFRTELFAKFQQQSLSFHRSHSTGELVTRMTSDIDAMEQSVLQGLTRLVEEVLTFIVVACMVLWLSLVVGSLSILPLAFAFVFIRKYNQSVKKIYAGVREKLGKIGSFLQDRLAGIQVTQSFARESMETEGFRQQAVGFYEASVRASRLRNTYFPLVSVFGFVNNLIMLGVGAWLIMRGSDWFTLGALIAYRGFWWRLQSPIRTIAQTSDILQRARASAVRILNLLEAPVAVNDSPSAHPWVNPRGAIDFRNVSFGYQRDQPVLSEVSFAVAAGEFLTIAGTSGSGKSTLLNLVPRFYDVGEGLIEVDGENVREYQQQSLRGSIGYVGQDNYLFTGTVRDNLTYGAPEATDEEVQQALAAASALEFIERLPKKYEAQVGQNGVKLSGGQRQRLSLARAFLTKPTILLLDEPTASVEPESESVIHRSILARVEQKEGTTLLVTHRVDLLKKSPRILFFEHGRLVAEGQHDQLRQECTAYAEAYQRWEKEEVSSSLAVPLA